MFPPIRTSKPKINAQLVSIRVDREKRLEIDAIYGKGTHLINGSDDWPNLIFLTPGGSPFDAGSYLPPEGSCGRPGFPCFLCIPSGAWTSARTGAPRSGRQHESFRTEFVFAVIQVYVGTVKIPSKLERGVGSSDQLALRFQSCDSSGCVPPPRRTQARCFRRVRTVTPD